MSVIGNPLLLGGDAGAPSFTTERSVRLRSSASAYFNRTTTTPTSGSIFTHSFWVKRGVLGSQVTLISGARPTNFDRIYFSATDTLVYQWNDGTSNLLFLETTQVFRDPSAWYHIIVATDTTQATNTNRVKIYVNGVQVTAFATPTYPNQSTTSYLNINSGALNLGRTSNAAQYLDGYLTEINFIDGQALTPSAFGEYDSVRNTQWKPKAYTGTYGTNGFYLKFANPASIGADSSGNSNTWTANNIQTSNSALTTYDSMLDVPTLTSATNSNYATFSPIDKGTPTVSQGNLVVTGAGSWGFVKSTFSLDSGKWYWEMVMTAAANNAQLGIAVLNRTTPADLAGVNAVAVNGAGFRYIESSTGTSGFTTFTVNDIISFTFDSTTGNFSYSKNGGSYTLITTVSIVDGRSWSPAASVFSTGDTSVINFGQRPFAYTPPTGYVALNTYNLPDPAVASSDDYHKIYSYTGNGGGLQVGEVQKPASLFNLDRSLRFRSSNTAYLSRTPAGAGSQTTWTWSGWVKRGRLGARQFIFSSGVSPTTTQVWQCEFNANDKLEFYNQTIGTYRLSTQIFRDPSVWYHIVFCADTNNGTAQNRFRCWVNGIEITVWDTNSTISSGYTFALNGAYRHTIAEYSYTLGSGLSFDGYLADTYFIDGQALAPTDFGAYDGNFYWTPKAYTGTYGTNGFHLEFEDNSASTAAAIGKDTSGNVNNWTPNNINLTTPENTNVSWDSMVDVPTLTSTDVANFTTLNPLIASINGSTLSEANLKFTSPLAAVGGCLGTIGVSSGKWYWEFTHGGIVSGSNDLFIGIDSNPSPTAWGNTSATMYSYWSSNGNKANNASFTAYGASYTTNDVIGVALDMDAGTIVFYKNGTSQGTAFTGLTGTYFPAVSDGGGSQLAAFANFGQRPFRYTPPTGFKDLNSFNIAEVLGDVETPDFVWIKSRSASGDHALFNSVTGVGKYLRSSNTGVETTDVNSLIQFNKNGFLLGNSTAVNTSATTYVASAWKAGNTTVTNTDGRQTVTITIASPAVVTATGHSFQNGDVIQLYTTGALPTGLSTGINYYVVSRATNTFQLSLTSGGSAINTSGTQSGTHSCTFYSQLRANQTAGFSVVTYAGTGTNITVGHGLGIAPRMVIVKERTDDAGDWFVYHADTGATRYLALNTTAIGLTLSTIWNNTAPTSSVFSMGNNDDTSGSADTYVAYCFSEIAGYSKFGSYISNNAADGPFVHTGFRPRWLIVKRAIATAGQTGGWFMYDAERNTYNVMDKYMFAESTSGEATLAVFDFTSNGFKIRSNNVHVNTTAGDTYIYMAFAEHPFKYALAR
jgi:hypothetical protein